jgi:uncharacterized protein (TIGR03083 family)
MEYERLLDVLEGECRLACEAVVDLSEERFRTPTRCPPWDVKALLAHLWRDLDRMSAGLAAHAPRTTTCDAVSYFRTYDPIEEGPKITARTHEVAERFATGRALALSFDGYWRSCAEAAREEDPRRLIRTRIASIRLDEFVKTRVLELAVHGLDLAEALDEPMWLTQGGAAVTRTILDGLLGGPPPTRLAWNDVTYIETGTGRRPLAHEEAAILGTAARAFPLLG